MASVIYLTIYSSLFTAVNSLPQLLRKFTTWIGQITAAFQCNFCQGPTHCGLSQPNSCEGPDPRNLAGSTPVESGNTMLVSTLTVLTGIYKLCNNNLTVSTSAVMCWYSWPIWRHQVVEVTATRAATDPTMTPQVERLEGPATLMQTEPSAICRRMAESPISKRSSMSVRWFNFRFKSEDLFFHVVYSYGNAYYYYFLPTGTSFPGA